MILKLDTKDGVRSWNLFMDDAEAYEILCDVIAFTLWRSSDKDKDWVYYHTVQVVQQAGSGPPQLPDMLKKLNSPFLKMMLMELNRMHISLGDEVKKKKGQTEDEDDPTDEG